MDIMTESPTVVRRHGYPRLRPAGYWLATAVVAGELGLGGIWDIAYAFPSSATWRYTWAIPSYFLVLLGSWKKCWAR